MFGSCDRTWKEKVSVKINHKQMVEKSILLRSQEFKPRKNLPISLETGKSSSELTSHHESLDIDVPITIRKGVRSCTKYLLSNFA